MTTDKCVTCGLPVTELHLRHPFKPRSQHLDAPYLLRVKKGSSFAFEVSCPELGFSEAGASIPKCREMVRSLMRDRMGAHQAELATFRYTGSLTNTAPEEPAEDPEEDTGHPWDRPVKAPEPCCSFCGKGVDDCGALIQATQPGSTVAICGECAVSAAHEVLTLSLRVIGAAREGALARKEAEGARTLAMMALKLSFYGCESFDVLQELLSAALQDQRLDEEEVRALFDSVCDAKGWTPTEGL
jgi:hypothetical protein